MEKNEFNLKGFRESLNLTQRELADKIGITQSTLNGWEKNPKAISFSNVMLIAQSLGFKVEDLLAYDDKFIGRNNFNFVDEVITCRNNVNHEIMNFSNHVDKLVNMDNLESLRSQLKIISISALNQNRKLNLALFGKSDAGKSTMINTLIGEEVSPTQWSATTRSVIKFAHINDKPSNFEEANTIVIATSITDKSVSIDKLSDKHFLDKNLREVGDRSLIKTYGVHNKELELEDNMIYTIFSFIDSDILEGINIIDTPGTSTGEHKRGASDTNASENTRSEADLVIYTSPINQFLQHEDQTYLKALLDYLPNKMDNLLNKPFSNIWIVATQAQIIDNALYELNKDEGIIDKSLDNFMNTVPESYFSEKGDTYTQEALKNRFFSFSRDSKTLTEKFKDDFISNISTYLEKSSKEVLSSLNNATNEVTKLNNEKIIELNEKAQDIDNVKKILKEKKEHRTAEFQKIDDSLAPSIERTDYYSLKSQNEFTDVYNDIMTSEYITNLIDQREFKNKKKDKEALFSLINNTISGKANQITKKYSTEFSDQLDKDIEDFNHKFNSFDFKRSFISLLSGGLASGALIAYMGTLGNLGGYILVTQSVGVLASMGISVGGGAAATSAVASIGGPVTIAVGLGVLLTMSVFAVSGIGWKKTLSKKIIASYEKEECLNKYLDSIINYWKDTETSLKKHKVALKAQYDVEIKEFEKEADQNSEYFLELATKIEHINNNLKKCFK